METYKDLIVWQRSVDLTTSIYELTAGFPLEERYGLASQMQRAAVSIPSNIAEGKLRGGQKEWVRFLRIAFGSGGELETQIEIAKRLPKLSHLQYKQSDILLEEVMRMLNVMLSKARVEELGSKP